MSTVNNLTKILNRVYRFDYNAGLHVIFTAVYGEFSYEDGYIKEKTNQIRTRGFTSWYCNLDSDNQQKIAQLMLDRYPDLNALVSDDAAGS